MARTTAYREQELLQHLAAGDQSAFDELFCLNWDHVYSAALVMTKSPDLADDIAQDAFLAVWKNRYNMCTIQNFKGFLHTSVKFLVHKKLRRMKVEDAYTHYLANKLSSQTNRSEQEESLALKQLQEFLQQGIAQLPPQQQRAFKLSREQGLTHEQISELMGVSKKTVKDYIVRSIAYLRPYAEQYCGFLVFILAISN
ncbi:MAG: sigma-70 family RNA polymerase sigma factor [Flavitalea sp.]